MSSTPKADQAPKSLARAASPTGRRVLPRVLVRIPRSWRGSCEMCAFLRAAAGAILEFLLSRSPAGPAGGERRGR